MLCLLLWAACQEPAAGNASSTAAAPAAPAPAAAGTPYLVLADSSWIEWKATEGGAEGHNGRIRLQSGSLRMENGLLAGGEFVVDMASITVEDLSGARRTKLEGHLKDADFFDAAKFPTGAFVITSVQPDSAAGAYLLTGNLTLRDSTRSIRVPAMLREAGGQIVAETPGFSINRTEWGVVYRSALIGTLADKIIDDEVGLKVRLVAKP
ncbi:MAG: YceI family protein [Bacteroidia bacterium]|nr:YceI family protein [Bacteroidia bacterium]